MLSEFHFLRPYWFVVLIPLAFLFWKMARRHLVNKHWESVCDPALLPYILVGKTGTRHYTDIILTGIVALLIVFALAGPTWERLPQPVFQKESALVMALDLSLSMYADDVQPNRLERARFKISDLLDLRKEGQTALLVYAGDAFTVTPLTDDIKTIKSQLSALSPDIMPAPGSNTGIAIKKAIDLLKQAGMSKGHILLITDEVDSKYERSFRESAKQGYKVSVLGIGTKEGAPIKLSDGSFLKDAAGTIVLPKLDQDALRHLAAVGDGRYETSQIGDADITRLNQLFSSGLDSNKKSKTDYKTDRWQEFGPWLVLFIIPFVAFGFRRGYLSILLCLFIIHPNNAMAFEWKDLWLNKNQRAMQALNNQQAEIASKLFQDDEWKAAAKYRAGDYAAAEKLLKDANNDRSIYNKANALARQGRYQEAIAAYDKVLKNNPGDEDAKFNKDLIEKELQKQQKQQQSQSDKKSDKNQEQNSKSGKQKQSDTNKKDQQQSGQKQQQSGSKSSQGKEQQSEKDSKQSKEQSSASDSQNSAKQKQSDMKDKEQQQAEQSSQNDSNESNKDTDKQPEQAQSTSGQEKNELDEEQQASEQWLRRIPDDPSGLLRRKFKYQYQQQKQRQPTDEKYW